MSTWDGKCRRELEQLVSPSTPMRRKADLLQERTADHADLRWCGQITDRINVLMRKVANLEERTEFLNHKHKEV